MSQELADKPPLPVALASERNFSLYKYFYNLILLINISALMTRKWKTKLITDSRGAGAWAFYGGTLELIFMPSHKSNLSRSHRLIERKNRRVFILLASESISFHFSTVKLKRCHSVWDGMGKVYGWLHSRSLFPASLGTRHSYLLLDWEGENYQEKVFHFFRRNFIASATIKWDLSVRTSES